MILKICKKKMQTKRKKIWMNLLGEVISNEGTENNSLMITR